MTLRIPGEELHERPPSSNPPPLCVLGKHLARSLSQVSSCCNCNLKSPLKALCGAKVAGAAEGKNRCSSVRLSGRQGLRGGAGRKAKGLEVRALGSVAAKRPKKTGTKETLLLFLLRSVLPAGAAPPPPLSS